MLPVNPVVTRSRRAHSTYDEPLQEKNTVASIYDTDLPRTPANYAPMTPLAFIQRTA